MKRLLLCLLLPACSATGESAPPDAPQDDVVEIDESGAVWNTEARVDLASLWDALSERYDADGDGRIPREDYPRGDTRFQNFDRDEDGVLTAADFPSGQHFNGFNHALVGMADTDGDGAVTEDEWWEFSSSWDANGDSVFELEEMQASLGPWVDDWNLFLLSFDQDSDGDFDRTDVDLTFWDLDFDSNGVVAGKELAGWQSASTGDGGDSAAAGGPAPMFALGHAGEPERIFDLEEALVEKPVALLFGSYT